MGLLLEPRHMGLGGVLRRPEVPASEVVSLGLTAADAKDLSVTLATGMERERDRTDTQFAAYLGELAAMEAARDTQEGALAPEGQTLQPLQTERNI